MAGRTMECCALFHLLLPENGCDLDHCVDVVARIKEREAAGKDRQQDDPRRPYINFCAAKHPIST